MAIIATDNDSKLQYRSMLSATANIILLPLAENPGIKGQPTSFQHPSTALSAYLKQKVTFNIHVVRLAIRRGKQYVKKQKQRRVKLRYPARQTKDTQQYKR